jgi:ribose 5-phosphate isomerase A
LTADVEAEKDAAARAAAELVESGMTVGLGTGTTVGYLIPALVRRRLAVRCVCTSPRTEAAARSAGLRTERFTGVDRLDIAIDGADQVAPDGWLIKGGGAAHTREKIVAASADRFVVIVDSTKAVPALQVPVPLELLAFGLSSTVRRIGQVTLRGVPHSPDGGVIADYTGELTDPAALASRLSATAGVVEHGLFPPQLVWSVVMGRGRSVEQISIGAASG